MDVSVHLLGDVRVVVSGEPVAVPRGRPALLLGVLALEAGRVVRVGTLIDALWEGEPPASAKALIHTYVSSLRRLLGDAASALGTAPGGYRLLVPAVAVDVHQLLEVAGKADAGADVLRAALAASREPLLPASASDLVDVWRTRVASAGRGLQERLWAVMLAERESAGVLPDLHAAVRDDPLREPAVVLLARALGDVGRRDEALAVLDAYRLRLGTELGLDSSPRIAEVRQDLLTELVPGSRAPVPPAERNQARTAGDRPDRRGGLLALAAAVVAAAVAAAVTAFTGTTTTPVTGPAVLVLDPESGALRDSAPLPLEPSAVHVGGDVIWVRSEVDSALAVLRVDGGSLRVQRVVGLVEPPTSLAVHDDEAIIGLSFSGKAVAVSSDRSSPPRPVSSALAGRLALDGDDDGVWAAAIDGALARLTGPPLRTPLPRIHGAPRALAVDGSHLWVAAFDSSELVRVHIHDGAQVASPLRGEPVGVSAANGQGWVVTASEDRLWRASDRGRVVGTSALPGLPVGVAAGTDRVWVAISRPAALAAYDPLTLELLLSVPLPREPVGVALDGERLVVALR